MHPGQSVDAIMVAFPTAKIGGARLQQGSQKRICKFVGDLIIKAQFRHKKKFVPEFIPDFIPEFFPE